MLTFGDFLLVLIPVRLQISLSCYHSKNTVEFRMGQIDPTTSVLKNRFVLLVTNI